MSGQRERDALKILQWLIDEYPNHDLSHEDFRVEAYSHAVDFFADNRAALAQPVAAVGDALTVVAYKLRQLFGKPDASGKFWTWDDLPEANRFHWLQMARDVAAVVMSAAQPDEALLLKAIKAGFMSCVDMGPPSKVESDDVTHTTTWTWEEPDYDAVLAAFLASQQRAKTPSERAVPEMGADNSDGATATAFGAFEATDQLGDGQISTELGSKSGQVKLPAAPAAAATDGMDGLAVHEIGDGVGTD